jgi:hypothetical protein
MRKLPWPKEFPKHRSLTRIMELIVQIISNEVKKGLEIGVPGMLGYLLTGTIEVG